MPKTAFVLSGGGAKGSFQVGILKQLRKQGIIPNVIYGTSVGAINAVGWSYAGIDKLEEAWLRLKSNQDIIKFQLGGMLFSSRGIFNSDPLFSLIKKTMSESNNIPINAYPIVCMAHIVTGDIAYVTPDNVHNYGMEFSEAVLASASLPLIMKPVKQYWVDGGIKEIASLRRAIEDGFDDIYLILTEPYKAKPIDKKNWLTFNGRTVTTIIHNLIANNPFVSSWLGRGTRSIAQIFYEMLIDDLVICATEICHPEHGQIRIHVYAPNEIFVDTLDFNPEKIRKGISLGERAVEVSDPLVLES